jgi:hypothetical protein
MIAFAAEFGSHDWDDCGPSGKPSHFRVVWNWVKNKLVSLEWSGTECLTYWFGGYKDQLELGLRQKLRKRKKLLRTGSTIMNG